MDREPQRKVVCSSAVRSGCEYDASAAKSSCGNACLLEVLRHNCEGPGQTQVTSSREGIAIEVSAKAAFS